MEMLADMCWSYCFAEVSLCYVLLLSRIKLPFKMFNCTNYNLLGNILKNYCFVPIRN